MPQGSILGSLFYVIYTNDIPNALNTPKAFIYADDTAITISNPNLDLAQKQILPELQELTRWFQVNKLKLNISKTVLTVFESRIMMKKVPLDIGINFLEKDISRQPELAYLGEILDETLSFNGNIKKSA